MLAATLPTTLPLAISGAEIFLALVFVVGGLVKHFMEKAAGRTADSPSQRTPPLVPPRPAALPPRPLTTPEEERARRLMEALGQSGKADLPPPPPVPPRPPPPAPPPTISRPAMPTAPPPPPPFLSPASDPAPPRPTREPAPASSRRVPVRPPNPTSAPVPAKTLRGLLNTSSRGELRRAILLREVLGPPRALSEPGAASM